MTILPIFVTIGILEVECNGFRLPRDLKRISDKRFKLLYGLEPLRVCHHPTKFGGHRYCDSGDMIVLVCNVIKGSCDVMGRCSSS